MQAVVPIILPSLPEFIPSILVQHKIFTIHPFDLDHILSQFTILKRYNVILLTSLLKIPLVKMLHVKTVGKTVSWAIVIVQRMTKGTISIMASTAALLLEMPVQLMISPVLLTASVTREVELVNVIMGGMVQIAKFLQLVIKNVKIMELYVLHKDRSSALVIAQMLIIIMLVILVTSVNWIVEKALQEGSVLSQIVRNIFILALNVNALNGGEEKNV
jgi:hypothetical protein